MKMKETAELLGNLATALDPFLKSDAAKDLRAVSECFRAFGEESTGGFIQFVVKAKEGKPAVRASGTGRDEAKINEVVEKITHFLDHRDAYDYSAIEGLKTILGKCKNAEIEEIGRLIRCPVKGTKPKMIDELRNWLINIKRSAEQSSFSLSGVAAS